jgi:hypothetical protein
MVESCQTVLNDFRHRSAPEGNDRGPAGHGFNHHETERLGPVDGNVAFCKKAFFCGVPLQHAGPFFKLQRELEPEFSAVGPAAHRVTGQSTQANVRSNSRLRRGLSFRPERPPVNWLRCLEWTAEGARVPFEPKPPRSTGQW